MGLFDNFNKEKKTVSALSDEEAKNLASELGVKFDDKTKRGALNKALTKAVKAKNKAAKKAAADAEAAKNPAPVQPPAQPPAAPKGQLPYQEALNALENTRRTEVSMSAVSAIKAHLDPNSEPMVSIADLNQLIVKALNSVSVTQPILDLRSKFK